MKNKKIKLQLNKETVEILNELELNQINGGTGPAVFDAVVQSSWGCITKASEASVIVNDAGRNASFWNCVDPGYADYSAKSNWVGNNNPGLDNTAVTHGQYICIKFY